MEEPLLVTIDDNHPDQTNDVHHFSSNISIILRLLSVLSIGLLSVWANHEASKGFAVTIINDANDTPSGKHFTLLYISNDKATRILLNTSSFVENLLYYHDNNNNNKIQHVTLHLTSHDPPDRVTVDPKPNNEFVININPSLIANDSSAVVSMLLQGIARVRLWDSGWSRAPSWIIDGMVGYINGLAGLGPVRDAGGRSFCPVDYKDAKAVAELLYYLERGEEKGFVQRLNQGLRDGRGGDGTVEDTLWMVVKNICDLDKNSSRYIASH